MYKLSNLPIEILYLIGSHLEIEDLITIARLNTWYGYWISFILGERIDDCVQKEGWRIHIDILSKSYPSNDQNSSFPFSTELLLLSEYSKINPYTLTLEFNLCPIDEDGLDAVKTAPQSERSIVLFNKIKSNIDIVAYFAQISTNRRLQHVNQAGAAIMNDRNLWKLLKNKEKIISSNMAVMGSAFKLQYQITKLASNEKDMIKLVDKFRSDYDQHKDNSKEVSLKKEAPAVISFDEIRVSPEWWVKQMKVPTHSSDIQEHNEFIGHDYW